MLGGHPIGKAVRVGACTEKMNQQPLAPSAENNVSHRLQQVSLPFEHLVSTHTDDVEPIARKVRRSLLCKPVDAIQVDPVRLTDHLPLREAVILDYFLAKCCGDRGDLRGTPIGSPQQSPLEPLVPAGCLQILRRPAHDRRDVRDSGAEGDRPGDQARDERAVVNQIGMLRTGKRRQVAHLHPMNPTRPVPPQCPVLFPEGVHGNVAGYLAE